MNWFYEWGVLVILVFLVLALIVGTCWDIYTYLKDK